MPGYFLDITNADIIDIDLTSGTVNRSFTDHVLCKGDVKANYYGARLYNNGEPIHVQGTPTVTGYFLRPDHNTVLLTGEFVDDATSNQGMLTGVILSQECYAYAGQFQLAIVVSWTSAYGTQTHTVRVIDGTIIETHPGGTVVPGNALPGINDLLYIIAQGQTSGAIYWKDLQYVYDYECPAGDDYFIKANDFQFDTPDGYTPVGVGWFTSGDHRLVISGVNPTATGNANAMKVHNTSNSDVESTAKIHVIYFIQPTVIPGDELIQGGTET